VRGPIERRNIGLAAMNKEFTNEDCFAMREVKKAATVVRETRREVGLGSNREAHPRPRKNAEPNAKRVEPNSVRAYA
jgi:hypothetical protein